ncbi:MAG: NAD-dependent epimerase/dehydratase family protein, partial [Stenotrophomonas maltophilia]
MRQKALVVGATGIVGSALIQRLLQEGWEVHGLARRPDSLPAGAHGVCADLHDAQATRAALSGLAPTHVFITTWSRQANEAENIRVNGAMVRHLLQALAPAGTVQHVALVTGLKHYLGPF